MFVALVYQEVLCTLILLLPVSPNPPLGHTRGPTYATPDFLPPSHSHISPVQHYAFSVLHSTISARSPPLGRDLLSTVTLQFSPSHFWHCKHFIIHTHTHTHTHLYLMGLWGKILILGVEVGGGWGGGTTFCMYIISKSSVCDIKRLSLTSVFGTLQELKL